MAQKAKTPLRCKSYRIPKEKQRNAMGLPTEPSPKAQFLIIIEPGVYRVVDAATIIGFYCRHFSPCEFQSVRSYGRYTHVSSYTVSAPRSSGHVTLPFAASDYFLLYIYIVVCLLVCGLGTRISVKKTVGGSLLRPLFFSHSEPLGRVTAPIRCALKTFSYLVYRQVIVCYAAPTKPTSPFAMKYSTQPPLEWPKQCTRYVMKRDVTPFRSSSQHGEEKLVLTLLVTDVVEWQPRFHVKTTKPPCVCITPPKYACTHCRVLQTRNQNLH